jgi:site-specific recombinase XerD
MIDELFAKFAGAFAENTIKAYRADFERFSQWCFEKGVDPLQAKPDDLASYIEWRTPTSSSGSIQRAVAGLGTIYRLSARADIIKAPAVVLAMKRMYREKGRAQKQAIPLTRDVLEALLGVCGADDRGLRDALMLRLGYETMRRRSELCSFRFDDLEKLPNGRAALRLRFSKTDQLGQGKLIPVSQDLLALIEAWSRSTGGDGYLLRRISREGDIGASLSPNSLNRRLQNLQAQAGLKLAGKLTGHSFRVGAALDLLESGESLEKIMLRGGWQAESSVIKYLRAWQAV